MTEKIWDPECVCRSGLPCKACSIRTVAFYGGSFNPPHIGHVTAVTLIANLPTIDKVLVPVCYEQVGKGLADYHSRLAMAVAAFGPIPKVEVTDVEWRLGGESLTLRTVKHLLAQHPNWKLRFAIGVDVAQRGPSWGEEYWKELCHLAPPLTLGRVGYGEGDLPAPPEASSSDARRALELGDYETARKLIPTAAFELAKRTYPPTTRMRLYGEPCADHGYPGCRCWEDDHVRFPG